MSTQAASGFTATFRRDGDKLIVKPGNNPEAPLLARSETRFQDPRGPFFEFQLDGQGKVTGAVLEQQGRRRTEDPAGAEVNREPERERRAVSVRRHRRGGGAPRNLRKSGESHDQSSRISWNHRRRRRCAGAHSGAAPRTSSSRAESSCSGPFRLPVRCSRSSASRRGRWVARRCRRSPSDVAAIKAVLKTFLDNGGKVVDVLHGGPAGEQSARAAAEELGIQNKFFWTTP